VSGEGGPDGQHVLKRVEVERSQGHDPVTSQHLHTVVPRVRKVAARNQRVVQTNAQVRSNKHILFYPMSTQVVMYIRWL